MAAKRHEVLEQLGQKLWCTGRHAQFQQRRLFVVPADSKLVDFVEATVLDHPVEDLGKDVRVDQVAFRLDDLDVGMQFRHLDVTVVVSL